jgi:hypothetical protein
MRMWRRPSVAKITKAHIRAAQARKKILTSQNKVVPAKIEKLAGLNIQRFPAKVETEGPSKVIRPHGVGPGFWELLMHGRKPVETELVIKHNDVDDQRW